MSDLLAVSVVGIGLENGEPCGPRFTDPNSSQVFILQMETLLIYK